MSLAKILECLAKGSVSLARLCGMTHVGLAEASVSSGRLAEASRGLAEASRGLAQASVGLAETSGGWLRLAWDRPRMETKSCRRQRA